jgi:hypothetical protein
MPLKSLSKIYLTFLLAVIIGFTSPVTDPLAACRKPAFYPGEKLRFRLRWGIIPAGEAELEVLPVEIVDGTETYHFVMTARTDAFIDTFYKYRSRVNAYADLGMKPSIKYRKKVKQPNRDNSKYPSRCCFRAMGAEKLLRFNPRLAALQTLFNPQ